MPKSKLIKKAPSLVKEDINVERDKGGRILAKKIWRTFNFVVEVAVESPGDISEEEAAEDAAEFITTIGRAAGRVHSSYCSVTRADEYGVKRPSDAPVFTKAYPSGDKADIELPRGILTREDYPKLVKVKPTKAKPKKKKKTTGGKGRF